MADYLVTDTELTSVANAIRTKGGTSANLSFPTEFVSAINAIPQSGITPSGSLSITSNGTHDVTNYASVDVNVVGSSYTKVYEADYTKSYTSTSSTIMDTMLFDYPRSIDTIWYVSVRDKAGLRSGFFYGSDTWIMDNPTMISASTSSTAKGTVIRKYTSLYKGANAENGIRARGIDTQNGQSKIILDIKYNSTYSGTINGTYHVEVWALQFPPGGGYYLNTQ